MSDVEYRQLLLHELSHIYLGHLDSDIKRTDCIIETQELEALAFTEELKRLVARKKVRISSIYALLLASVILSVVAAIGFTKEPEHNPVSEVVQSAVQSSEIVYITPNGHKYHKSDCYHIAKSKIIELTSVEAERAGYEPCKDCFD